MASTSVDYGPQFSPDGRRISPLYRLDPASGRRELVGMLDKGPGVVMGLAVSPDARTILYGREMATGSDLMMIENFR
jgi:hypothetical protein